MSRSRFAGQPERVVFDEVVQLLKNMDFQDLDSVLRHAHPGTYSGTAPVAAGAWLARMTGTGAWESWDGTRRGTIRIVADTEVPEVSVQYSVSSGTQDNAPAALVPTPLEWYTLEHDNHGTSIRACFQIGEAPDDSHWEVFIHGSGVLQGRYRSSSNDGVVNGKASGEFRPHNQEPPPASLEEPMVHAAGLFAEGRAAKRVQQPVDIEWKLPEALAEGTVILVAIGGAPCSSKGTLMENILQALLNADVSTKAVGQDAFFYSHLADAAQGMLLTPGMVRWQDFLESLDQAVAQAAVIGTKKKPGVVLVEGPLVYWMQQLDSVFKVRFFMRVSRHEFFRRQQSKSSSAGHVQAQSCLLEHVAWPAHLAYGQPRKPPLILDVPDGIRAGSLPREVLEKAVEVLRDSGVLRE